MSARSCATCHNTANLRRCNGCKKVLYCSVECQQKDWKSGHKKKCKLLRKKNSDDDVFNASNDIVMDLRDSIQSLYGEDFAFNTNKIQEFWSENYQQIAKNIIKKFKFEQENEQKKYLNDLSVLLSKISFSCLKKSRSIINGKWETREIWKLEFWCCCNLRSIQTNYAKCHQLHLYFKDRDYKTRINPKIYINIKSSVIYHVLSQEFELFEDIILLILEYLPYNEGNYCLLRPSKNAGFKFRDKTDDETVDKKPEIQLSEYIGVEDNLMIRLLLNSIKAIFALDQSM